MAFPHGALREPSGRSSPWVHGTGQCQHVMCRAPSMAVGKFAGDGRVTTRKRKRAAARQARVRPEIPPKAPPPHPLKTILLWSLQRHGWPHRVDLARKPSVRALGAGRHIDSTRRATAMLAAATPITFLGFADLTVWCRPSRTRSLH